MNFSKHIDLSYQNINLSNRKYTDPPTRSIWITAGDNFGSCSKRDNVWINQAFGQVKPLDKSSLVRTAAGGGIGRPVKPGLWGGYVNRCGKTGMFSCFQRLFHPGLETPLYWPGLTGLRFIKSAICVVTGLDLSTQNSVTCQPKYIDLSNRKYTDPAIRNIWNHSRR